jgi:hypothetical protein
MRMTEPTAYHLHLIMKKIIRIFQIEFEETDKDYVIPEIIKGYLEEQLIGRFESLKVTDITKFVNNL